MPGPKPSEVAFGLACAAGAAIIIGCSAGDEKKWRAEYWNNPDLSGPPALQQLEDDPSHNWAGQSPAPGIIAKGWSARWTRRLRFDQPYTSTIMGADYACRLLVDGQAVLDYWTAQNYRWNYANVQIPTGMRELTIEYSERWNNSWLHFQLFRTKKFSTPPAAKNIMHNGDLRLGWDGWGKLRHNSSPGHDEIPPTDCDPEMVTIIDVEGTPTLHLRRHPPDMPCSIEAWNCQFPRIHPGDTITVQCRVRTGPPLPGVTITPCAGIGLDIRPVINGVVQETQISEMTPFRIQSDEWVTEHWKVHVPLVQKKSYDQEQWISGRPDQVEVVMGGQGRNTTDSPIGTPMPDEMTLCIWVDLHSRDRCEWSEYQDAKVWITPP